MRNFAMSYLIEAMNKTTIALSIAALLMSGAASADSYLSTRALYQGLPSGSGDHYEALWNVAPGTTSQQSISVVADGGLRDASAWARLDTATGAFKGKTFAQSTNYAGDRTAAWAEGGINDMIRVNSANAFETVQFTVRYDSVVNTAPISTNSYQTSSPYPIRHTDSNFSLGLWHDVANPYYVEGGESSQTIRENLGGQDGNFWSFAEFTNPSSNGGSNVRYSYYEAFSGSALNSQQQTAGTKGHWSGELTFAALLPTNEDVHLDAMFSLNSFCFMANSCVSSNDSSNSFYLGARALGGTLVSQSGYHYNLGVAPVPEPETYAMMLAGLGIVGFAARRRSA
ncbi:FxDxF family PEP-CTERM protein [Chitinivorax sp. PXF-14]|uniref:FxDxF family PEP-CTERM protein n=1 Tax=Chitinivorax sp. PXF-14 TaxID=3230488 RepID=UPI00346517B1